MPSRRRNHSRASTAGAADEPSLTAMLRAFVARSVEEQLAKERAQAAPSRAHHEDEKPGRRKSYPHLVSDHGLPPGTSKDPRSERTSATKAIDAISSQMDDLALDDQMVSRPARSARMAPSTAAPERTKKARSSRKAFDLDGRTDELLNAIEDMADRLSRSADRSDLDELREHIADLGTLLRSKSGRSVRVMTFHRLLQDADRVLSDIAAANEVAVELQAFHARLIRRMEAGWDQQRLETAWEAMEALQERMADCVEEDCLTGLRKQLAFIHAELVPDALPKATSRQSSDSGDLRPPPRRDTTAEKRGPCEDHPTPPSHGDIAPGNIDGKARSEDLSAEPQSAYLAQLRQPLGVPPWLKRALVTGFVGAVCLVGILAWPVVSTPKVRDGSGASVSAMPSSASQTATRSAADDPAVTGSVRNSPPAIAGTNPASSSAPTLAQLVAAADGKDPRAAFELAGRFREGRGVTRDPAQAAKHYAVAAEAGIVPALYWLASLHERGEGVPRDANRARSLYQRAAEAGNAAAMHNLAVMLTEGEGGARSNYAAAVPWFKRAADHGYADSQYNLAILHARGLGVPVSLTESYKWFALAARGGDEEAGRRRDEVASRLGATALAAAKRAVENFTPTPEPEAALAESLRADRPR